MQKGFAQEPNPPSPNNATIIWPISPEKWPLVSFTISRQYDPVTKTYITLTREVREMNNPNFIPIGVDRKTFLACGPNTNMPKTFAATASSCSYVGPVQIKQTFYSNGLYQTVQVTWSKFSSSKPNAAASYYKAVSVNNSFRKSFTSVGLMSPVSWSFGCGKCFVCGSYPDVRTQDTTGSFTPSWYSGSLTTITYGHQASSQAFAGLGSPDLGAVPRYQSSVKVVWGRSISTLSVLITAP